MRPTGCSGQAAVRMVVDALRPFAASDGRSFVRYPTPASGRVHDAVLDKDKMLAHSNVLQALFNTKIERINESVMDTAAEELFDAFREAWQLSEDEKISWVKTISLRCRVMVSLVKSAAKKNASKVPQWVQELGVDRDGAAATASPTSPEDRDGAAATPLSMPLDDYKIGVIESKGVAFRIPINTPRAKKELPRP